jgi:hypothetical protein
MIPKIEKDLNHIATKVFKDKYKNEQVINAKKDLYIKGVHELEYTFSKDNSIVMLVGISKVNPMTALQYCNDAWKHWKRNKIWNPAEISEDLKDAISYCIKVKADSFNETTY